MRLKILCFFLFSLFSVSAFSQEDSTDVEDESFYWNKPTDNEKSRLGIVMGLQTSSLPGTAIPGNRLMFGLLGGGYGRLNFKNQWSLQQAMQVSFRGGDFKAGTGEIRSLRLLYLDAPVLLMKQLGKESKHKIGIGIQYSALISATMYLDNKSYPTGQAPKIDRNDWGLAVAYQYQLEYFALQLAGKYGFRNLNLGKTWPDSAKPLNNNGTLYNFAIEMNLIF